MIFGEFISKGENGAQTSIGSDGFLNEILKEFTDALNVPYAFDMSITHGENNTVVPIGMKIL